MGDVEIKNPLPYRKPVLYLRTERNKNIRKNTINNGILAYRPQIIFIRKKHFFSVQLQVKNFLQTRSKKPLLYFLCILHYGLQRKKEI